MDLPEQDLGPKMQLLDARKRKFAWNMACGGCTQTEAARLAGYSDHLDACKVTGHHLMRNRAVLDAIEEAGSLVLRGLAPLAIQGARAILENPKHRAHARMIETVLDRTGHFARTEHKVLVEHSVDVKSLEELARRLAVENGIAPDKFIGLGGGSVIEGEAREVVDDSTSDGSDRV